MIKVISDSEAKVWGHDTMREAIRELEQEGFQVCWEPGRVLCIDGDRCLLTGFGGHRGWVVKFDKRFRLRPQLPWPGKFYGPGFMAGYWDRRIGRGQSIVSKTSHIEGYATGYVEGYAIAERDYEVWSH